MSVDFLPQDMWALTGDTVKETLWIFTKPLKWSFKVKVVNVDKKKEVI